ncbi:MAG: hypothetical protein KDC24_07840 [Saprospiraceae bacterium]|nr:hypothetical protein [Saprospiraceae bacterium]
MDFISQFNVQRLGYLLIRDIKKNWRSYAAFMGGFFAIIVITSISWALDMDDDAKNAHLNFFPFGLLAGGFLFTSVIFREFGNQTERAFYLGIPASNLEKLLSKLIISNFLFIVVGVILYFLFSIINNSIVEAISGMDIDTFNPFMKENLEVIKIYFVLHSIFFLGALAFPRYSLPKTILAIFIIITVISLVLGLVFRITFDDLFDSAFQFNDLRGTKPHPSMKSKMDNFGHLMSWVFTYLTAPVLWIVSYFKLSEKEV